MQGQDYNFSFLEKSTNFDSICNKLNEIVASGKSGSFSLGFYYNDSPDDKFNVVFTVEKDPDGYYEFSLRLEFCGVYPCMDIISTPKITVLTFDNVVRQFLSTIDGWHRWYTGAEFIRAFADTPSITPVAMQYYEDFIYYLRTVFNGGLND